MNSNFWRETDIYHTYNKNANLKMEIYHMNENSHSQTHSQRDLSSGKRTEFKQVRLDFAGVNQAQKQFVEEKK